MTPQHLDALAIGSEIRLRRAELKREIKAGEVQVSELLIETAGGVPDWLENFAIAKLLDAMHRAVRRAFGPASTPGVRASGAAGRVA